MENNNVIESRQKLGYENEYFIIINGLILEVSSIYTISLTKKLDNEKYKINIILKNGERFHILLESEDLGFAQEIVLKIFNTLTQTKKENNESHLINENADLKKENAFLKGMFK